MIARTVDGDVLGIDAANGTILWRAQMIALDIERQIRRGCVLAAAAIGRFEVTAQIGEAFGAKCL